MNHEIEISNLVISLSSLLIGIARVHAHIPHMTTYIPLPTFFFRLDSGCSVPYEDHIFWHNFTGSAIYLSGDSCMMQQCAMGHWLSPLRGVPELGYVFVVSSVA